jgi:hypothetical protein
MKKGVGDYIEHGEFAYIEIKNPTYNGGVIL